MAQGTQPRNYGSAFFMRASFHICLKIESCQRVVSLQSHPLWCAKAPVRYLQGCVSNKKLDFERYIDLLVNWVMIEVPARRLVTNRYITHIAAPTRLTGFLPAIEGIVRQGPKRLL